MKHQPFQPIDGLPDAPLAMPKQTLERPLALGGFLRAFLLPLATRHASLLDAACSSDKPLGPCCSGLALMFP